MNAPPYAEIERAVWLGTAAGAATAVLLTIAIALIHRAIVGFTRMHLLAVTMSLILSIIAFVLSGTVMMLVINSLVNSVDASGDSFSIRHTFVDPGVIQRLTPAAAIVLTWTLASRVKRRRSAI